MMIDCDTGRDDALSIWLVLALGMDLSAVVTSYGNTIIENVSENSARVLALAGRNDIALWQGTSSPSRTHKGFTDIVLPRHGKAGNGLCNLELPRAPRQAQLLTPSDMAAHIRAAAQKQGPVDYIILGPATNFSALCDQLGDDLSRVIASVTMMGGKMDDLWQQMPGADFNIVCDPYAVDNVLACCSTQDVPVRFVPMNVTWPIVMELDALESLRSSTDIGRTSCALMVAHARYFAPEPVFRFHDPCVILTMLHADRFRPSALRVICDDQLADFGRLVHDDQGYPAAIFEADSALRDNFLKTILDRLSISRA